MKMQKVKLGDICEQGSSNIVQKDILDLNGKYPIFGASGLIKYVDFFKQDREYIGIVKDGAGVGRTMILPAYSSIIGTMQYIFPKDNINIKFLFYILSTIDLSKYHKGATIPHIYFNNYKNEEIYLPTIEEQKVIAERLDKLSELIEKRKEQIKKLDLLIKSRFIEMFGDITINDKKWDVVSFLKAADFDCKMINDFQEYMAYPHIGIDSIEKDTGNLIGYRTILEDNVISGKYLFSSQHILYSKIRPNLNKVALPNFNGLCSADAYPILPKKDVCNRWYLAFVLRSKYFLDYILQFSSRTNLPKVNKKEIAGFSFPLPPLELQNKFAVFVEKIDKLKQTIKNNLEKLETLKKSLMQQYFG